MRRTAESATGPRRTAESATDPRRLAEFRVRGGRRNQPQNRGGWRNFACAADGGINHRSAAAGGNHFCARDAPRCSTSNFHLSIAHCCTDEKLFWVHNAPLFHARIYRITVAQICITFNAPFLLPAKALNYPDQMLGHTMCSESGPQFRPIDSVKCFGQIQADIPHRFAHSQHLSITRFADTRCSSRRRPPRNPCCSSGWFPSNTGPTRASTM